MFEANDCPGCGGELLRGFIFDRGHYDYKQQQLWVEGEPEESFWSGIKTSDRDARKVDSYRCVRCNRLEFFAAEGASI